MVISLIKDSESRPFVDSQALNKRKEANTFPTSNMEEMLEEMAGAIASNRPHMFDGYCQVRLAELMQGGRALL